MKTFLIILSVLVLPISVFAIPSKASDLVYSHSYQYPVSSYKPILRPGTATSSPITNKQPNYQDSSGIVSVSVFVDNLGLKHYYQIPNSRFNQMIGKDGASKNLTPDEAFTQLKDRLQIE